MSSSPFDIFRRNLKPLMVLLTGLAMFAFVVLPVLDSYMRRNAGTGGDEVIAKFGGVNLTRGRVDFFTRNHQSTIRFLRELAEATISRGGVPRVAGFEYDPQNRQIQAIGINESPGTATSIRTFQFASEAVDAGFLLDDVAIQSWLQQFTDGMFSDAEINGMLLESTRNQMGRYHLYEQLRQQLLASLYIRGGYSTLSDGRMPLLTPAEQWDTFLKLNRNAIVNSYGVLVSDYLDQTNKTPGELEIAAVYEEGKDKDPFEQSPDPAFHRRYSAKFEYLVGNYQSFLEAETKKLTEEQLRAEYQRRLSGGDFQLPEKTTSDLPIEREEVIVEETTTTPPETVNSDEPPAASPSEPPAASPSEPPAASPDEQSNDDADAGEPAAAPPTPAAEDQSRSQTGSAAIRLVAFKDNDDPAAKQTESDNPAESEPTTDQADAPQADAPKADTPKADTPKADAPKADAPKADAPKAESQSDAPKADAPKADGSPEETPQGDGEKNPSDADKASADDKASEAKKPGEESKSDTPKVESFEDVRDQIAEDLAGPDARRKMDTAVTELTSRMRLYFNEKAIYDSNQSIGQAGTAPVRPDLKALGKQFGFDYESIGPYDQISISDEPISESFEVGTELMRRGPSFAMMMYGVDDGRSMPIPRQQLFSPLRTADDQTGKIYVSWKTAETEAYTPTLAEARDEVIMAIRSREARKLACAAAEELAKKASASSDTPLAELVPADKRDNVKVGLGPFSWLHSFGFQGATIGNVPELDSVGPQFMKTVFEQEVGKYGVAFNNPERVVYVVKATRFEPSLDELRRRFKEPTNRMMALLVGGSDTNAIIQGFYKAVDEQTGFAETIEE